jgi:primosomal protein N' (replication factor Y) (superfamily II helicase)
MIGICGERQDKPPEAEISYKPILEILDIQPVLSAVQMKLAKWMAEYYRCTIGNACFAMLPNMLIPDIKAEVKWVGKEIPPEFEELANALQDGQTKSVDVLRKTLKGRPVLLLIEKAFEAGLVESNRKLSPRDKPKTVNYLRILDKDVDLASLTSKQREAMQLILALAQDEMPLASISDTISYAVIHALEKKGIVLIVPRQVEREFFSYDSKHPGKNIILNQEQQAAVKDILEQGDGFGVHLLFGITGSGKTEVYLPVIRSCLEKGKNAIFLIPEIALTPQMVERFQAEFGSILAISHSQLSDRQRLHQWQKIAAGECRIVIGARSAVFSPMPDLGLIIVDEEHEQSYKQDNTPRYHGRDLAIMRAKIENVPIVLGSATPSLESWFNQQQGKYHLHTLVSRPLEIKLPEVRIIDLCEEYSDQLLSDTLVKAINERLEKHEQIILFQNRRGFSSFLQCLKCGELIKCANCEISMYYHRDREEMHCHYCGNSYPSPRKCPKCGSFSFAYGSPGTQKVDQILQLLFPDARVLRLDSDSARKQDSYKTMYRRMKDREVDILLGTQMISKGLDFPNVTLVGIVNADISLNVPDFRAAERTFQLCTQVAGRSGRADKKGEVIIQTFNPQHYSIVHAGNQDFPAFAEEELSQRIKLHYPPYYRLARILYQCADISLLQQEMQFISEMMRSYSDQFKPEEVFFLGPAPAPVSRVSNLHRHHIIIKGKTPAIIKRAITLITEGYTPPKSIYATIDVDPTSLM